MMDDLINWFREGTDEPDEDDGWDYDAPVRFACPARHRGAIPEPTPASKSIPQWFKRLPGELPREEEGVQNVTAKRCPAFLDAMTLGWTIPLTGDLYVEIDGLSEYEHDTKVEWEILSHFNPNRLGDEFPGNEDLTLKFVTPWKVMTKPGWSVLMTHPLNHGEMRWRTYSGIMDADTDPIGLHAPCQWLARNYSGVIKAGTPVAQVIAFKRDALADRGLIGTMTREETEKHDKYCRRQRVSPGDYRRNNKKPKPAVRNEWEPADEE